MMRVHTSRVTLLLVLLAQTPQLAIAAELDNAEQVASVTRFSIHSEILNGREAVAKALPSYHYQKPIVEMTDGNPTVPSGVVPDGSR